MPVRSRSIVPDTRERASQQDRETRERGDCQIRRRYSESNSTIDPRLRDGGRVLFQANTSLALRPSPAASTRDAQARYFHLEVTLAQFRGLLDVAIEIHTRKPSRLQQNLDQLNSIEGYRRPFMRRHVKLDRDIENILGQADWERIKERKKAELEDVEEVKQIVRGWKRTFDNLEVIEDLLECENELESKVWELAREAKVSEERLAMRLRGV